MLATRPDSQPSKFLDLCRGLSAIYVVIYHLQTTLFAPFAGTSHLEGYVIYFIDSGYLAVMIFFVLSGFLISSSVISAMTNNRWSWKTYLTNRLTRLWIVLIPALLLTLAWDKLIGIIFDSSNWNQALNLNTLIGNIFFMQTLHVQAFGGNGPLWSLAYEFWYYLLFPCLILAFRSKGVISKVIYVIVSVILMLVVGKVVLMYFIIWLLGAALVFIPKIPQLNHYKIVTLTTTASLFLFSLVARRFIHFVGLESGTSNMTQVLLRSFTSELFVGVTFSLLLYTVLHAYNTPRKFGSISVSRFLASFSYTLYLTHFPVMMFIVTYVGTNVWEVNVRHNLYVVGIATIMLLYAWLVSRFTEAKTSLIRRVISEKILMRRGLSSDVVDNKLRS